MSRDLGHALDMLRFARRVRQVAERVGEEAFRDDWTAQGALLHYLTVLGEAARRTSEAFRIEHPDIDWPGIVGLRNRIVHEYDDYDMDIVWRVASVELPMLIERLEGIVPQEPDGKDT